MGEITFPYYTWNMSAYHKAIANNSIDCSYSGSRVDRTYFTYVNQSAGAFYDPRYEIYCANYKTSSGGARAFKKHKRLFCDIQGTKYPNADGLTDADPTIMKAYTEHMEQSPCGLQLCDYTTTGFYSLFDYTGAQNIFAIPQIQAETGERVQSRFINVRVEFDDTAGVSGVAPNDLTADGADKRIIVWHLAKKILVWNDSMSMDILE